MRQSNVDISKLPKFTTLEEAKDYFNRLGKLTFFGWEGREHPHAVYTYKRNNGVDYFVDIYEDGQVVVIQRSMLENKDF